MRYLIFLFLTGCTLSAQQQDAEKQKDAEFNKLIDNAKQNQSTFKKVHSKAEAKEKRIVSQTINKIVTLKEEVKDLKSEISGMKIRVDTVYIHDTIQIKEKKSFWGKTKVDTTNNE
jgi:hypothetical protein